MTVVGDLLGGREWARTIKLSPESPSPDVNPVVCNPTADLTDP